MSVLARVGVLDLVRLAVGTGPPRRVRWTHVKEGVVSNVVPEPNQLQEPLLPAVARGDEAGVREFNARYAGLVWSIVRRLGVPSVEAEDAVQDIFVELWRSADRFDASIASEPAFVAMIARRRAIDRIRRVSKQADGVSLTEAIEGEARDGGWRGAGGVGGSGRSEVEFPATPERAVEALDRLSPDQQRVLRLSLFRGLSHELIARSLDMPLGTVKTHARRGLIRLRDLLAERREVAT